MALKNFDGAVAIITGGASGIGLATAQACYTRGAHIVLADINEQRLQQAALLVQQSRPSSSAQIVAVTTDVTDEEQVQALMHRALDIDGRIDLVVTCAGLGLGGPIDDFTASEMQLMMNVNFMGTFHSVKAAVPSMRKQQSGHFVLLSSVAGKLCPPLLSGYTATKWAVRGFSSSLRAELYGTGIGITTVYPAWVDTPMVHQETSAMQSLNIEILLTPQQVAEAIIQAAIEEKNDLTLAPNHDIAALLQIMQSDQDKAEQLAGTAFQQRMQQLLAQKSNE
jgi:NAD(P)-dependent dehydrogenase (short-subunit alcohol dehydrogenase family)